MSHFFFCHYIFKKPSAAEASESVYMRERVKTYVVDTQKNHLIVVVLLSTHNIGFGGQIRILKHAKRPLSRSLIYDYFQLVDMRWGVPIDAADDHLASKICMEEIQNCQKLSTGPNFVVNYFRNAFIYVNLW